MIIKPYIPEPLPVKTLDKEKLFSVVGEANAALARYDGMLGSMVNPVVMVSPLTNQEAVLSSKIEGTQATVEEVLEHEAGQEFDEGKKSDIKEILNYRKAMRRAKKEIDGRPVSLALLRELHKTLMSGVRGKDKTPGEFRKDQNWIGRQDCKIEEAMFVPPNPLQLMDHLQAWERYLKTDDIDAIIQTAIVHAQFELIHPFKDGNGRIGRLLIPLFLYKKSKLSSPIFYLSAYLEKYRAEYYERLMAISVDKDWTGWVYFFLIAVIKQAEHNNLILKEIMQLYDVMKTQIRVITHSPHSAQIVDTLFVQPIFTAQQFSKQADIPKPTTHKLFKQLTNEGILHTVRPAAGRRPAILAFAELLNTLEQRQIV